MLPYKVVGAVSKLTCFVNIFVFAWKFDFLKFSWDCKQIRSQNYISLYFLHRRKIQFQTFAIFFRCFFFLFKESQHWWLLRIIYQPFAINVRQRLWNCLQSLHVFHNGPTYFVLVCFAAGFALQAYRSTQKPSPMEVMKTQATRLTDNPVAQAVAPPKMEIPTMDGRRQGARPHKLKPRDMNILTPSGFWGVIHSVKWRRLQPVTFHLKC